MTVESAWVEEPVLRGRVTPFEVGDTVSTDYAGRVTHHLITAVHTDVQSQSRVMYTVLPVVRGSSGGPIDHAWFTLITRGSK